METNNFQWDDNKVREFIVFGRRNMHISDIDLIGMDIEKFKQSKVKKEEPKQGWEILSLKGQDGTIIYKSSYTYPECFQTLVNAKDVFIIHSVKRLSDNTVWTEQEDTHYGVIEKFTTDGKFMCIHYTNGNGSTLASLTKKSKPEEPLPIKVEWFGQPEVVYGTNPVTINYYDCKTSAPIPKEKYEPIKKAIEGVLRGNTDFGSIETFTNGYSMGYKDALKYKNSIDVSEIINGNFYTKDQLLEAQQKGHNKAIDDIIKWIDEVDNSVFALSAPSNELKMLMDFKNKLNNLKTNH